MKVWKNRKSHKISTKKKHRIHFFHFFRWILLALVLCVLFAGGARIYAMINHIPTGVLGEMITLLPPQPPQQTFTLSTGCQNNGLGGAYVTATIGSNSKYDFKWGYVNDSNIFSANNQTSPFTIPGSDKQGWMRVGQTGYVKAALLGTGNYNLSADFTVPNCTSSVPTPTPDNNPTPTPAPGLNPIQIENQRPGTTSWIITKPEQGQPPSFQIKGYAWTTSATPGQSVIFSVSTGAKSFSAGIYRLGWYQGQGGRLITSINNISGKLYPTPSVDPSTGLNPSYWPASFSLTVGNDWVSGVYVVVLTEVGNGYQ